jgi:hypothetical protein
LLQLREDSTFTLRPFSPRKDKILDILDNEVYKSGAVARKTNHSWFLPREHGAWGIVVIPFLTAVIIAGPVRPAVWVGLGAVLAAFIARYPIELLIVPGVYRRAGSPERDRVRKFAWAYGVLATALGVFLLAYWRLYLLLPLGVVAVILFLMHIRAGRDGEDRSLAMELVGTVGLTLTGLVGWVAATGGLDRTGLLVWALNGLFFCSGVLYVKARIRSRLAVHRPDLGSGASLMVGWHVALVVFVAALVTLKWLSPLIVLPFGVAAARAAWGARQGSRPFVLTRLGWSEVALSVFFAMFLTLGFRL